jgi:hypothetical protein
MSIAFKETTVTNPTHPWLRQICVAFLPGPTTALLQEVADDLLRHLCHLGHQVQTTPDRRTDVILTAAHFGESTSWRKAPLFTARRRFGLSRTPAVYTLMHVLSKDFEHLLDYFRVTLAKEPPDPADYSFPGLAPQAHRVLFEQGRRGGPILAVERLVQAQAKSIHIILVVGDDRPLAAYHFDLVGAYPRSEAHDLEAFYTDIAMRIVTAISTTEVNQHQAVGDPIERSLWQDLSTPAAMRAAGRQLGERNFFTEMVRIADLVSVPAVGDAVASQYSEGCFSTWDPTLGALIATVTGSARPVDKGNLSEDELAVIVGVRPDGKGALMRHVEGKRNDPPSSEAVEMLGMDSALPTTVLGLEWGTRARVPAARSKLHGHRGVGAYDPRWVEHVPLDPPYYYYPVSCATEAQARGIKKAFSRSQALRDPNDHRQVVFTVLPGHGVVIVEKWVPSKAPFQVMWEYMDANLLEIQNRIPQGLLEYVSGAAGRMLLHETQNSPVDLPCTADPTET